MLGVDQNATKCEIKAAFRKLAIKYHPDKHAASSKSVAVRAALLFDQISVAYNLLSNDSKRVDYDSRHSGSSSSSFEKCNVHNCMKQSKNMQCGFMYPRLIVLLVGIKGLVMLLVGYKGHLVLLVGI